MLNPKIIDEIESILYEDHIGFWVIHRIIGENLNTDGKEVSTALVLKYVRYLMDSHHIIKGDTVLLKDGRYEFNKWCMSSDECFEKLNIAWKEIGYRQPEMGEINCYFTKG